MTISYHERPGVYSDFDASSVYAGTASGKTVGLVAQCHRAEGIYILRSSADADAFSDAPLLCAMLKLLFQNGAGKVLVSPAGAAGLSAYTEALTRLLGEKEARIVLTDSNDAQIAALVKTQVEAQSAARNECVAVIGTAAQTDAARIAAAQALNSARVMLAAPESYCAGMPNANAIYSAAALAGLLAGQTDPAMPLHSAALSGLTAVETAWSETELDALIRGGVTPIEFADGAVRIVRGVSTKTTENGAADTTWKEMTTILTVDDVITGVRSSLQRRFPRAKNNAQTRSAIRDQVVMDLENCLRRQIIDTYSGLTVEADPEDPTICDVIFSFGVCHGMSHILLSAHISI